MKIEKDMLIFHYEEKKGVIFMNEIIHKMEQHVSVRKYKEESIPKDVVEKMVHPRNMRLHHILYRRILLYM